MSAIEAYPAELRNCPACDSPYGTVHGPDCVLDLQNAPWLAALLSESDKDRELLAQAADALWGVAKAALTVKPLLDHPYPDAPQWTPWTRWMERRARTAHDLKVKIRRHLKLADPDGDSRPQPGTAEFDARTAELRGKGFGFEADARDRLAAERRAGRA